MKEMTKRPRRPAAATPLTVILSILISTYHSTNTHHTTRTPPHTLTPPTHTHLHIRASTNEGTSFDNLIIFGN